MDREIAELMPGPEEAYAAACGWPEEEQLREIAPEYDVEEFVPTPECLSDCYDNQRHCTLCMHAPEPF